MLACTTGCQVFLKKEFVGGLRMALPCLHSTQFNCSHSFEVLDLFAAIQMLLFVFFVHYYPGKQRELG